MSSRTSRLRRAVFALVVIVAGCARASAQHVLEPRLLATLQAEDPAIRRAGVYVLGLDGGGRYLDAIAPLLDDADSSVRRVVVQSLARLSETREPARTAAARHLLRALHDGSYVVRLDATYAVANYRDCGITDWRELSGSLADASGFVRCGALQALARLGVPVHERDVEAVFRECAGGSADASLALALDLIRDPAQREIVRPLLDSGNARVRRLAQGAMRRLGEPAACSAATLAILAKEREYAALSAAARSAFRALEWHAVERKELFAEVAAARLVLVGEIHRDEGPLRDVQCELLRAFDAEGDAERFGFEPSVQRAQQAVIDAARGLGMETVPTEATWRELLKEARHAERDDETAAVINEWLADPKHRMFVIRGESHTLPDGYLVRRLQERPLIVLTVATGSLPLASYDAKLSHVGKTWRIGAPGSRLYACGTEDLLSDLPGSALRGWLEK